MDIDLGKFYETVVRYATVPVLALLLVLSWLIVSRLLSPEWQRKRRSKEIRKAVAEREKYLARRAADEQDSVEDEVRNTTR